MATEAWPTETTRNAIEEMIDRRGAALIHIYFEEPQFAGHLFDKLGQNPRDKFIIDDLLATSLLDVPFRSQAVREMLGNPEFEERLRQIGRTVHLWDDCELGPGSDAWTLWSLLTNTPGIGGTRASKLLARKRPRLFPILDPVIRDHLGLGDVDAWAALRAVVADDALRESVDALWEGSESDRPSTLRLLDVMTWMSHSDSRNARRAQQDAGIRAID